MNLKKCLFYSLVAASFLIPVVMIHAESNEPVVPKVNIPKERQKFNKLKVSTRNIYKVTMRSTVAFKLQTALGYVSTIDLPEKALKVFVGDQELFKVEVFEKQVLVKPITEERDAQTNLVIITDSGRLVFDVTIGPAETSDFVLDFRLPVNDEMFVRNAFDQKVDAKTKEIEKAYREKERGLEEKAEMLSQKKLKEKIASGIDTIELKESQSNGEIRANLLSLSQVGDKAYLRFSVQNYSKKEYAIFKVFVGALSYDKKLLHNKESNLIEFPSDLQLPEVIKPETQENGMLIFDIRMLGKNQKAVIKILKARQIGEAPSKVKNIEIAGFHWFK